ncbi:MAG: hypothetical protein NT168_06575 [Planctomycetota bacterium]|nr:hypothetical protein [Planctomycetota bacterium]
MLPNANLSYLGLFKPHSTVSCVASSVASILLLLCSSVQAAEPLPSTFQTDDPKSSIRLLGYNEHRTDLPGGRHANVRTNRAVVVQVDGQRRRPIGSELIDDPALTGKTDAWTQFAGWSPDGKTAIVLRGWESVENARWEEENKTFRFTPEGWLVDSYLIDLQTNKATNVTAVDRVSFYNTGLFFWPKDPMRLGFTPLIDGNSKPFRMDIDGRNKTDLTTSSSGFAYGFSSSARGLCRNARVLATVMHQHDLDHPT